MKLAVFGQVVICLSLALACHLWLYFLASVWMGFFRAVINTVPFILANQISRETAVSHINIVYLYPKVGQIFQ